MIRLVFALIIAIIHLIYILSSIAFPVIIVGYTNTDIKQRLLLWYIAIQSIVQLHWKLLNNECFASYLEKNLIYPEYKLGECPRDSLAYHIFSMTFNIDPKITRNILFKLIQSSFSFSVSYYILLTCYKYTHNTVHS